MEPNYESNIKATFRNVQRQNTLNKKDKIET